MQFLINMFFIRVAIDTAKVLTTHAIALRKIEALKKCLNKRL